MNPKNIQNRLWTEELEMKHQNQTNIAKPMTTTKDQFKTHFHQSLLKKNILYQKDTIMIIYIY